MVETKKKYFQVLEYYDSEVLNVVTVLELKLETAVHWYTYVSMRDLLARTVVQAHWYFGQRVNAAARI